MGSRSRALAVLLGPLVGVPLAACGALQGAGGEPAIATTVSLHAASATWTGVRRLATDGSEEPLSVRVSHVLGGAATLRELEVRGRGSTYRGLAIDTFDRERDVWLRTYVNAPRGRPVVLTLQSLGENALYADVQVWRSTPGPDGRCSENRTEHIAPDRERTTVSRSADHGVTWTPLFSDELRMAAE